MPNDDQKTEESKASEFTRLESEVRALFADPPVPNEVIRQYIGWLKDNLSTTEQAIGASFWKAMLPFILFVLLDSGLVERVALAGAELKRSSFLLLLFPLGIAFFNYQLSCRVILAHELRTVIALLFKHTAPAIYHKGLDLLIQYPSIRNIETYEGKRAISLRSRSIVDLSTTIVTLALCIGPLIAIFYCFVRTYRYADLSKSLWLVSLVIAFLLVLRTEILFFSELEHKDVYAERKREGIGT